MRHFALRTVYTRIIFSFLILIFATFKARAQDSSRIIMANLSWIVTDSTNNANLLIYLEDTVGITSISVEIDSVQDGNRLYNSQFNLLSLPSNCSADESTILLDLGELPDAEYYYASVQLTSSSGLSNKKIYSAKK